mmetsp:Transcript_4288/g.9950  ORF Transcript_4288/g.9950 Transcript_4288/m.9950 type:complete len:214 (-) Transcript_4288:1127-1768(-)
MSRRHYRRLWDSSPSRRSACRLGASASSSDSRELHLLQGRHLLERAQAAVGGSQQLLSEVLVRWWSHHTRQACRTSLLRVDEQGPSLRMFSANSTRTILASLEGGTYQRSGTMDSPLQLFRAGPVRTAGRFEELNLSVQSERMIHGIQASKARVGAVGIEQSHKERVDALDEVLSHDPLPTLLTKKAWILGLKADLHAILQREEDAWHCQADP